MAISYTEPLTRNDVDVMNSGSLNLGPEGSNVITYGECLDLAEFFGMPEHSIRRWFLLPSPSGAIPEYRRLVPISRIPGDPNSVHAIGRTIATMYPDDSTPDEQRMAINDLRFRVYIGACAGVEGGMERDAAYHGKVTIFNLDPEPVTLSSAIELVEDVVSGFYGEHGEFIAKAWFRIEILDNHGIWRVRVSMRGTKYGEGT